MRSFSDCVRHILYFRVVDHGGGVRPRRGGGQDGAPQAHLLVRAASVPASFAGQVWGLIASGTVISPLIPSINAKATLSTPIALSISDELDLERKKAGACGLFGACYVGVRTRGATCS